MRKISVIISVIIITSIGISAQSSGDLLIKSQTKVGQIEVGGPFVGIEIHNSFPMLNRISFYYPVANSIDISSDYWKREKYRIMSVGLKIDDTLKTILHEEIYNVEQTPYSVSFSKKKYSSLLEIDYNFSLTDPVFTITYTLKNISNFTKDYELYTRLENTLKTSHTYSKIDTAVTSYNKETQSLSVDYNSLETAYSKLFIKQDGLAPASFISKVPFNLNLDSLWLISDNTLSDENIADSRSYKPISAFIYEKSLKPGEEFKIVQIIGMANRDETDDVMRNILTSYKDGINDYKDYIENKSKLSKTIITGDSVIDFTSQWSSAILATNAHYLEGEIVPMPAQAEYNFYFTHDALLTDLAAVNFDTARVKKDLEYIIGHANDELIIPHAYYWKDEDYKTEYCGTENWNHFWFTIVAARHLKHSNDILFAEKIYPFVKKSIETALKNKGDDTLMWSFRPDWWDIGNNYGPRAYMTILAIRALKEFCFLSTSLTKNSGEINYYYNIAESLENNLERRLWNSELNYLTSFYQDGAEDKHIYMGSMLAAHFNQLDETKRNQLMATAKKYLLDENLGVYTLFPMDLHKLIDYMGFAGNEAGDPYYYANGGIWPHGNAWYALGLSSTGNNDEAFSFLKNNMTIDGIMNSPNGQPAMYEYRISDKNNPEVYGKIDKPQFLWAGGWYLYTLYNLLGIQENEWNISISPLLPNEIDGAKLNYIFKGDEFPISIKGKGNYISSFKINDQSINSAIIPADMGKIEHIDIINGELKLPYLKNVNAILNIINYDKNNKILEFKITSFENAEINFEIISPFGCAKLIRGDTQLSSFNNFEMDDGSYKIKCFDQKLKRSMLYKIYLK